MAPAPRPRRFALAILLAVALATALTPAAAAQDYHDLGGPSGGDVEIIPDWLLLIALAFLPLSYLTGVAHEAGHALLGRLGGLWVTSFGMGMGRPFLVVPLGGTRFYLAASRPLQGLTFSLDPDLFPRRLPWVMLLSGGLAAHALLAAVGLALVWAAPAWQVVWWLLVAVNVLFLLINAVPFRTRVGRATFRTDGALILDTLRRRSLAPSPPARIQTVAALAPLWKATADRLGLYANLLEAAGAWLDLGDVERAEQTLAEAEAAGAEPTPFTRGVGALVRAMVERRSARCGRAAELLDEAERAFAAGGVEGGAVAVALERVRLAAALGELGRAADELERVAGDPILARRPSLGLEVQVLRLGLAIDRGMEAEAVRGAAEYEAARLRHPSHVRDLSVYRGLGELHANRAEWDWATRYYRSALDAARELYLDFALPADRERLARLQSPLVEAARECLRKAGRTEDAEKLEDPFTEQKYEAREARRRRGPALALLGLIVLNLLAGVAAIAGGWVLAMRTYYGPDGQPRFPPPGTPGAEPFVLILTLGASLILSAAAAGVFYLARLAVGAAYPGLKGKGNGVLLWIVLMPWIGWVALMAIELMRK